MRADLKKLFSIANAKKISYVLFVSKEMLISADQQRQTTLTIASILEQSVPLCDLLILTPGQVLSQLKQLIDQSIEQCGAKYLKAPAVASLFKNRKVNDSQQINSSKASPCIRLYALPTETLDNIGHAMTLLKTQIQTEWIIFLDRGAHVAPSATYQFTQAIIQHPGSELIYADHDVINSHGARSQPTFKPVFSLDLLYSQNYIGSFFAIRTKNIYQFNASNKKYSFANYTFYLILFLIKNVIKKSRSNLTRLTSKIIHLPFILHSENQPRLTTIQKKEKNLEQLELLTSHLSGCYTNVSCSQIKPFIFRTQWPVGTVEPLVSLILPTKDGYDILKACVSSIIKKTTYKNYEIIIVDNQTTDVKTLKFFNKLRSDHHNIQVIQYDQQFNYSDINNTAVKHAKGQILGFLNNDVEVITPAWLTEMVSHAIRPDIGCVGAMHYYPDQHIQHAGVIVGMNGVADHAFRGQKKSSRTNARNYLDSIRNPDAVTAATLVVKRELFDLVGGFDSQYLKIAFNDVDLCLKLAAQGYRCLWTPYAELFHHESKTRNLTGLENDSQQTELFEHRVMKERWQTGIYPKRDLLRSISLLGVRFYE